MQYLHAIRKPELVCKLSSKAHLWCHFIVESVHYFWVMHTFYPKEQTPDFWLTLTIKLCKAEK